MATVCEEKEYRTIDQISPSTYRSLEVRAKVLGQFIQEAKEKATLLLQVNLDFVRRFKIWATSRQYGTAYQSKVLLLLKATIAEAWAEELIPVNTLATLKLFYPVATPVFNLTDEEVEAIEKAPLQDRLRKVADAFLFALECCLHYSDYDSLRDEDVQLLEGRSWIIKARKKSRQDAEIQHIPLTPRALNILSKYGHRISNLPRYTNGYLSRELKRLAEVCGISRKGSIVALQFSHARDTGIGRMVRKGTPDSAICAVAGWKSTQYLRNYAQIDYRVVSSHL